VAAGSDAAEQIRDLTDGGADLSIDALGSGPVIDSALRSLRPRGRLIQIGLLPGRVELDLGVLIGRELQWLGSHSMSALDYPALLALVERAGLRPGALVRDVISLTDAPAALAGLSRASRPGITIIRPGAGSSGNS
jgi:alcohol dehydrogenase